jgi:hypothetical protein
MIAVAAGTPGDLRPDGGSGRLDLGGGTNWIDDREAR